ncbi:MAG: hypothetical protein IPK68_23570 [Bdellovibrionales bacterium]|nr:hypothetical protein [Bdellovibrionales bacterium]
MNWWQIKAVLNRRWQSMLSNSEICPLAPTQAVASSSILVMKSRSGSDPIEDDVRLDPIAKEAHINRVYFLLEMATLENRQKISWHLLKMDVPAPEGAGSYALPGSFSFDKFVQIQESRREIFEPYLLLAAMVVACFQNCSNVRLNPVSNQVLSSYAKSGDICSLPSLSSTDKVKITFVVDMSSSNATIERRNASNQIIEIMVSLQSQRMQTIRFF